ncbi:hypothetical protein NXS19_005768 [Fusarium pseudograminearum]|nr:hypothetical protein NXS19_005768 [Fusarium pseudograminearum]
MISLARKRLAADGIPLRTVHAGHQTDWVCSDIVLDIDIDIDINISKDLGGMRHDATDCSSSPLFPAARRTVVWGVSVPAIGSASRRHEGPPFPPAGSPFYRFGSILRTTLKP